VKRRKASYKRGKCSKLEKNLNVKKLYCKGNQCDNSTRSYIENTLCGLVKEKELL
jgi:hypothetical protein